ncbi:siderophore synthetase component [Paenibacillus shirakamiensis]|uniref:Siderophore synthetase component n=1 Tax=Paenibacillus shirakamiensis TaxID=1265935 RepID=A0ABS4JG62_9BACL|nr:IucA/IucC family protein [Paenibacillus shirakamiensis]MBP1999961.1 siderophore synthetase component [Paenibacillus shirakamiensis]
MYSHKSTCAQSGQIFSYTSLLQSERAQQEMLNRLFNAYLRETGQFDPYYPDSSGSGLTAAISLPDANRTIYGSLLHRSITGHHTYGEQFYTRDDKNDEGEIYLLTFEQIVTMLLDEVSLLEPNANLRELKRVQFEHMVFNSLDHMSTYLEHAVRESSSCPLDFRYVEQLLLCGHPFHPTPKSLEGFSASDSAAYSPELGVAFPLSCFAVSPEYVSEDWLDSGNRGSAAPWIPVEMLDVRSLLPEEYHHYVLIPCHPWQAAYLVTLESVRDLLQQKLIIDLGSTGPLVYPTSSVRTVWNPQDNCFYKLSLHIRITNFIRENSMDQLLRTLDASRIVQTAWESGSTEFFHILLEKGCRTVHLPGASSSVQNTVSAGFSMILREAPDSCLSLNNAPYVIASLLEVLPGEREPLLFRAVRDSSSSVEGTEQAWTHPDWFAWLREYLELSMMPILKLYADYGISLEAHVQNSMITMKDGRPHTFVIRDLEGISVNRTCAEEQGWVGTVIKEDSPVLYTEEEARYRLKYYFFVNHLSHLIQRLALYTGQQEQPFWGVVRNTLVANTSKGLHSNQMIDVIQDLLTTVTLPAKANLISRFHQRGETPLYVDIPNPLLCADTN